ncbi:MAG: DUF3298 and DUF4163 domain-containing protein [Ruminococcaceae bacterium]|jgi:hypothetical protein|nr:DUF3298 and DUF4163 domain-containing protein [Oscillospiraceae bacterium]
MKKLLAAILAAVLALSLFGCGGGTARQPEPNAEPQTSQPSQTAQPSGGTDASTEVPQLSWNYDVEIQHDEMQFTADDGTVIASWSIKLPHLVLKCDGDAAGQEPPAELQAVCDAFNSGLSGAGLWEGDIEAEAKEEYAFKKENNIEFFPLADETEVGSVYLHGNLLSVYASDYVNLGGAHPDWLCASWDFDLSTGKFFTLTELAADPAQMLGAVSDHVVADIYISEIREGYYENFEELIRAKADFDVFFDEDGMTVWFQEYDIGPHALGIPAFTIPYAEFGRYLNARGKQLLALSVEDEILSDFYEADEMWYWFEGLIPLDYNDSKTVQAADVFGGSFDQPLYRVDLPGVTTIDALRAKLMTRLSENLVDRRLDGANQALFLQELDGALYAMPAGRGDDMYIDSVSYRVDLSASKVIATIVWRDYDEAKSEWVLTGATTDAEFPYEMTENGAVFTDFCTIW